MILGISFVALSAQLALAQTEAPTWPQDVLVQAPMRTISLTWADGQHEQIPFASIDHFEMAPAQDDVIPVLMLVDTQGRRVALGAGETLQHARFLTDTVARRPLETCASDRCGMPADSVGPRIRLETLSLDLSSTVNPMDLSLKKLGPTDIGGAPIRHLDKEGISAAVKPHEDALLACYQSALRAHPHVHGTITVEMTIQADGHVSQARVSAATLQDATVQRCVLKELRAVLFPKPQGAAFTTISHTMNFEPVP